MNKPNQKTIPVRVRIVQALLPSNNKCLDPSELGVLELALAKSLGYKQTADIDDQLENLERDGIITRKKDKTVKTQNKCRLNQDRETIRKLYCQDVQYECLQPEIRADFSRVFLPTLIEGVSKESADIIQEFSTKSHYLFTIILEKSTKQEFTSAFHTYLDTYQGLGIEDHELSTTWLWYLLLAHSVKADEKVEGQQSRQQLFKKMGILVIKAINEQNTLQRYSDNVRLIQMTLQISGDKKIFSTISKKCELFHNDFKKYEDEKYRSSREALKESLLSEYQKIEAQLKQNQGTIT